jgi:hypothetical protein
MYSFILHLGQAQVVWYPIAIGGLCLYFALLQCRYTALKQFNAFLNPVLENARLLYRSTYN